MLTCSREMVLPPMLITFFGVAVWPAFGAEGVCLTAIGFSVGVVATTTVGWLTFTVIVLVVPRFLMPVTLMLLAADKNSGQEITQVNRDKKSKQSSFLKTFMYNS